MLVERIIQKILKDKVDIDKLLVVTFTNAAAAEMRERVLDAIYKKLDDNPEDENLQKQIVLLSRANICTIHSFCLDVIRNNFFEIDLSANFRIASNEECELLRQEVLEEVFEELYEIEDSEFEKLVDNYSNYRGDESIQEMVLNVYKTIQSMPYPEKWLHEKVEMFRKNTDEQNDFTESQWGKILIQDFKEKITDCINNFKMIKKEVDLYSELRKYSDILQSDIEIIEGLEKSCTTWDSAFEYASHMPSYARWSDDKNIALEVKNKARTIRDNLKKKVKKAIEDTLFCCSKEAYNDIYLMHDNLVILEKVVLKFSKEYKARKKSKNIIDFNDIEHFALEILQKPDVAKKYQEKFEEIAIDEYQDSNEIQEFILKSVSRGNNIFMVGDVKQSIYKFRQACPELFLKKYDTYSKVNVLDEETEGRKIQLFQNFRSSQNILDMTNAIFQSIMSKQLGDIDYTEEEFLNLGADYPDIENGVGKSELHIIDLKSDEELEEGNKSEENNDKEEDNESKNLDKIELEAIFVRNRIQELINCGALIKKKDGSYKKIEYRDIVILLRSTKFSAPIFENELMKNNIPVFSDANNEYLETVEVQTIINLLKILDNPFDDIKMVSVMRSPIGGFTDNEILEIRLNDREDKVYNNLINYRDNKKVEKFLSNIESWREEGDSLSLAELIWKIYIDTGFFNYVGLMPNGVLRQANLKMLFERAKDYEKTSFSGLFNFIRFMERLKMGNSDMASAKVISENENVVRIMSIHKSKGLEFPVVFLSVANKQMNFTDLRQPILLHKEVGFGPEYVDYERKIRYKTAAKQAIKIVGEIETISEEMRILYVALTRAKEKLIITGTYHNIQKEENNKKDMLSMYGSFEQKLNYIMLKKNKSYLDWIYLVYLTGKLNGKLDLKVHSKDEFEQSKQEKEEIREFEFEEKIDFEEIEKNFKWEYRDSKMINIPQKTTVSELKNNEKVIGLEKITLKLAESNEKITPTQKGTWIHNLLQKLDFRKEYSENDLMEFAKQIFNEKEVKCIDFKKIKNFFESNIYERIKNAKQIEKEKYFCFNKKIEEYDWNEVCVQGIVDLYFIDEKNQLVLVDYKTDIVEEEELLKKRYFIQLEIYREALESALNRKVDETYIYSTHLNKWIHL